MSDSIRSASQLIPAVDANEQPVDVGTGLPLVDFFLDDERLHWDAGTDEVLFSDEFVEAIPDCQPIALQARARCHAGADHLIIEQLGERFDRQVQAHQMALDSLLTRDHMASEIAI